MSALPFPYERAFHRQIRQVTRCRRRRRACDRAVVARAHAAPESFRPFYEHAKEHSALSVVQLSRKAVEQLRFVDEEFDKRNGATLRFNRRAGKPGQPLGYFIAFVRRFQGRVVARATRKDRGRKGNE